MQNSFLFLTWETWEHKGGKSQISKSSPFHWHYNKSKGEKTRQIFHVAFAPWHPITNNRKLSIKTSQQTTHQTMGIDKEAKPELHQQTGEQQEVKAGAGPTPSSVAVPRHQQWDTVALSQPGPACHTCPGLVHSPSLAPRTCQEGRHQVLPFQVQPKGDPLAENRRAWPTASASQPCLGCHRNHPTAPPGSSPEPPVGLTATGRATATLSWGVQRCSAQSPSRETPCSCRPCASLPAPQKEGRDNPPSPPQNMCNLLKPVTGIPLLEQHSSQIPSAD